MGAGKFTVEAIFTATDRMTSTLAKMDKSILSFAERNEKRLGQLSKINDGIASGFKKVGAVVAGAGIAAGAVVSDIIKVGAEFDRTLVGAAAKFDPAIKKGTAKFEQLRIAAEEVGAKTEFSAQQAAEGLEMLAGAGLDADQAIAALPVVIDAATAAGVDFAQATEISTEALGAFSLKSTDAQTNAANLARVTNVLAQGAGKTSASMADLSESIKEGGPVAVAAGQSLETFVAMAGSMADVGIKGGNAGTMLKNVFTSLAAPSSKKAVEMLKKLGIQTKDSKGNMRDVVDIMGDLGKATKNMGTGTRLASLETIFGKIPLAGVTALLDKGSDKIKELRTELEKATAEQAAAKLAATMRDTVTGDIDSLTSAIDGVKIAVFNLNQGPIRDVIQGMTKWVQANQGLIVQKIGDSVKWISDNMETLVKWTERFAIAAAAFFTFKTGVSVLSTALQGYKTMSELVKGIAGKGSKGCEALATAAGAAGDKCCCEGAAAKAGDAVSGATPAAKGASLLARGRAGLAGAVGKLGATGAFLNTSVGAVGSMGVGGMLAAGAAVAGAGAAGYAFGSWLNDKFGISDSIVNGLIGGPERTTERGLGPSSPQVVTPQERISTSVEKTQAEILIRDETGNATLVKQPKSKSVNLSLTPSGAF